MIISSEELIGRYANGEKDFTSYSEIDFQRINLPGIDLSDVRLGETFFSGANLIGANLSNAFLRHAHIDLDCNLMNSNMTGANLHGAMMNNANLSKSNLQNADLTDAKLIDINLCGTNLTGANLRGALFNCVNLTGAIFQESQLSESIMRGSSLLINEKSLEKSNIEILDRLTELSHGEALFDSEGEDKLHPFVWEIVGKEALGIGDLISYGKYNQNTEYKIKDVNHFHYPYKDGNVQANERYNALIEIFRNDLTDVKIYWLEETCGYSMTLDVYLIGKTKAGSFAGLSVPHLAWLLSDVR
jgi:Nuclease A inhibitor-like protein/Pentapeptide repeats (8 copies)